MSGSSGDADGRQVRLPLLDRLLDAEPDRPRDPPPSAAETIVRLRQAVRRDVEALLNARRPWLSVPERFAALRRSPLGYGIADFTAGAFNERQQRQRLCADVEDAIGRFEPRLSEVRVQVVDDDPLRATLRLRIDALLNMEPAPEIVVFDTEVDPTTAEVVVRPSRAT